MRYAIFSDVHANRQAWGAVREDILLQGADTLVCLGDVVGYGPKPLEVLSDVRGFTSNFVLGNHDAAACGRLDPSIFNERARLVIEWTRGQLDQDSLDFLGQVPLQMDGQELQFVHAEIIKPGEFGYVDGIGAAEVNLQAMTASLGFIGHTHLPLAYTMPRRGGPVKQLPPRDFTVERGQRYLVNVGSVGEPRTTDVRASYVIYDDVARTVSFRRVAFDVEGYKADLASSGLGILPYFVQVVDAGRVAGAPQPAAAPQLALAQLPRVTEVVSGTHARLVVGAPAGGVVPGRPPGRMPMVVSRPRSSAPWVIGIGALVAVLLAIIAIAVLQKNPDAIVAPAGEGGGVSPAKDRERSSRDESGKNEVETDTGKSGPIRDLKVRRYDRTFQNLGELRAAAAEEHSEEEVGDGLLNLVHAGTGSCGLVWEGDLLVPEYGLYEFTLQASSGAALVIYEEEQLVSEAGSIVSGRTLLRSGHAGIRVEFFQKNGEPKPSLALRWSGPGLEKPVQLVRQGASSGGEVVLKSPKLPPEPEPGASIPDPVEPGPVVERKAPENISEELFAYWACDRRDEKPHDEFVQKGSDLLETLIKAGQPMRYLRPSADPGSVTRWTKREFDDSADWLDGENGLGYEDRPGEYRQILRTTIETTQGMHPHSLYVRIPFEVRDPADYKGLELKMLYDDGFVAYLNGSAVGSRNAPAPVAWNSGATEKRNDREAKKPERVPLNEKRLEDLVPGKNVLAIHALNGGGSGDPNDTNTGCSSSDMLIMASLVGVLKKDRLRLQARKPGKHDRLISQSMIRGTVTQGEGKFGESYNFEGGSLDIGGKNEYAIASSSYTLSLWFTSKPEAADGEDRFLISAGGSSAEEAGWALWIPPDGNGLNFRLSDGDQVSDLSAGREGLTDDKWHHAAVTIDRENKQVHLFIDGVLSADPMGIDWVVKTLDSGSGLCIGGKPGGGHFHRGAVDDVALWHRALLPEEIEKLFEAGTSAGDLFATEEQ